MLINMNQIETQWLKQSSPTSRLTKACRLISISLPASPVHPLPSKQQKKTTPKLIFPDPHTKQSEFYTLLHSDYSSIRFPFPSTAVCSLSLSLSSFQHFTRADVYLHTDYVTNLSNSTTSYLHAYIHIYCIPIYTTEYIPMMPTRIYIFSESTHEFSGKSLLVNYRPRKEKQLEFLF